MKWSSSRKNDFGMSYITCFLLSKLHPVQFFCHNSKITTPFKLIFISLEPGFKGLKFCCFEKNLIRTRKPSKTDPNQLFLKILTSEYLTPAHGKICNSNTVTSNQLLFVALEPRLVEIKRL